MRDWFGGEQGEDPRVRGFVGAAAEAASAWPFAGLSPSDTATLPFVRPGPDQLLELRIPGLTTDWSILRVLYEPSQQGLPTLQSEWTAFAYPFEGAGPPQPGENDLWVTGVDASPQQCGRWAAAWIERQLRRTVVRREWDRPTRADSTPGTTRPLAVEWVRTGPDDVLDSIGTLRHWRLRRGAPTREVTEWYGAPT